MTKYLLFAFSDCKDPKREIEFNDWYDNMHMTDMMEVPGFIKASRWMSADNKKNEIRKYLALYELETDDLAEFNAKMRERGIRTMKEGRFTDLAVFDPDNVPRIYVQITPEKKAKPPKKAAAAKKAAPAKKAATAKKAAPARKAKSTRKK
ncbi:MAG: hypothetical protein ABR886_03890 [Dehalococcoidales bacterium]|jgi:uncharacterized protein (DUF1684 family)